MKMPNIQNKDRILKATREKHDYIQGEKIQRAADISTQTLKAKMDWNNIFKSLEEHRC